MDHALYYLSLILPTTCLFILSVIVLVNIYLKLRRQYPVKVNCWFCNEWTYVDYDKENSFECPKCMQYNGFTPEGDYNRSIPAQYDEMLNKHISPVKKGPKTSSNGLCHFCNNNQQLKMYQLANFVPMREDNFDLEIEHFQKQLEKAYKLCSTCDSVVKTTIQKQNCLLGLSFAKLRKQGLNLLDLNNPCDATMNDKKRAFIVQSVLVLLFMFAVLNLLNSYEHYKKIHRTEDPQFLTAVFSHFKDISSTVRNVTNAQIHTLFHNTGMGELPSICANAKQSFFNVVLSANEQLHQQPVFNSIFYFLETVTSTLSQAAIFYLNLVKIAVDDPKLLCVTAILMQLILWKWEQLHRARNIIRCVLWMVLTFSRCVHLGFDVDQIQILGSFLVVGVTLLPMDAFKQVYLRLKREQIVCSSTPKTQQQIIVPSFNAIETKSQCDPNEHDDKSIWNTKSNDSVSVFNDKSDTASLYSNLSNETINRDLGLNDDLKKLNLGSFSTKSSPSMTFSISGNVKRPRQLLSPTRLQNVAQKSWGAGGYWRTADGILLPMDNVRNSSRASSQSSGIGECNNKYSPPPAVRMSCCCDQNFQCAAAEPIYYQSPPLNRSFGMPTNYIHTSNYLLQSNSLNSGQNYFLMQRNVKFNPNGSAYSENMWNRSVLAHSPSLTQSWINSQKNK